MWRRILAIILLLFAIAILVVIPILVFTPQGARWLTSLSPQPSPTPVLTVRGTPPTIKAESAYVLDADTGNTLVNIDGNRRLPMASTTKIMTAIITIESGKLDQVATVGADAVDEVKKHDGSSAQLVVGDKIRLKDLIYGLMLPSGDDAAIVIADTLGGNTQSFVKMMNDYAQKLRLKQTHYINPDGLTYMGQDGKPDPNHYSSASDLVQLTRYAMRNSLFAQIVQLQQYNLPATDEHHEYTWKTTNDLLGSYAGATGVKTGFTEEAGYCLVFAATSGNHHLIGAVMKEKDMNQRFVDADKLLDWAFALPVLPPTPTPQ